MLALLAKRGLSMRNAALTLTIALSLLSACADAVDPGVTDINAAPYPGIASNNAGATNATVANASVPFFTTDPAYFANPPAYYGGETVYLTSTPYYASDFGYFVGSRHGVHHAYCPPRGGYARAGGSSHHR
jgi:hypothetical protein